MPAERVAELAKSELTSLRWMMLLGGILAIVTVLIVSVYLSYALEREAFLNWQQQSRPLAKTLAGQINQEINKATSSLRLLAALPEFQQLQAPESIDRRIGGVPVTAEVEKRRLFALQMVAYPEFSVLFILKENGDHYLAHPFSVQQSITKYNMSDRAYFQETVHTRDTAVSDSFTGADGKLAVAINTPIKTSDGTIAAHLGGVFHLEKLSGLLQQFKVDAFDELILIDRQGELIGHSDPGWLAPKRRRAFLMRPEIDQLLHLSKVSDDGVGTFQELWDPTGEKAYLTFTLPLQNGWQMIAMRDRSTVLSNLASRFNIITATTALILLGIAGFGLAFVSSIGKRWEQAEQALKSAKRRLEAEVEEQTHELLASHEHAELLLDSSGAAIFGINCSGYCTFFNSACLETLNYPVEEDLEGRYLSDIIQHCQCDGTPYSGANSPILDAIRMDKRIYMEHEIFCTADGHCMPVEYRSYPMRRQGEVVGAVVTFNDISMRIHARQAQADSDARFRSLFAQSNDAIFLLNSITGQYLDANRSAEILTGRSLEELLKLKTSDICPIGAEERRQQAAELDFTRDLGRVVYIQPDGSERTALLSVVPLTGGLVFGIAHDITDQLASERALRQSEAHLRALSEAAFEAIFISEKGICLSQNLTAEKLFGYTLEEALGCSGLNWIAEESRDLVKQNMRDGYLEPYEAIALRKDGSTFPAEIRGRAMEYQDRQVQVTALRDISDRYEAERKLQHTNALFQAVIDQAPFAITIGEGSANNWSLTLANQEAQRITGATAEQQRQIHFVDGKISNPEKRSWEMLHTDGTPIQVQDTPLVKAMSEQRVTRNKEMVIRRIDGMETYVLGNASPIYGEDGNHIAGIFIYPDITELKRKDETIRTLSQAMEQSPVAVIITDPEGIIEYTNRGFELSSGYRSDEVLGKHTRLLRSGNTTLEHYKTLWETISKGDAWQGEFHNQRKDGSLFWEYAHISPIFDDHGNIRHYLAVKEDITIRKVHEEKILHQAHYDSLTGLPNRFLALDRLAQILRNAQREEHKAAVLFLDLDDFKKVNDTLGHEVGDQVIEEAARRVSWSVRDEDTVGRLGGDEFIVLLANLQDKASAGVVAEKILSAFRTVFRLGEQEILLTTSVGISVYPDDGDEPKLLLRNADTAMYHSKAVGRNAFHFYTNEMNQDVARRLELEGQLHGALENNEFYLCYQPIVNIYTQSIVGAEALLRWNNPLLGEVSPVEFIEIAERTGGIVRIGEYVMRQAVKQAKSWSAKAKNPFRVAVNVSPVQFKDKRFLGMVQEILDESQLPGDFLEIEVTENVLLSEKINSVELLNGLRDLGISISMDDFGTGYSSLSYLRNYPFDTLKIDRSFIRDITSDPEDRELVVATISMAKSLGLKVIAEGVETAEQLAMLQAEKCDFAQGYYFSKPIPEAALERFFLE
ncbi:MAG: EAL domain-containing protein [Sedimenticola thiotaurini]|uniref:cyclic-guanylate-specific phosphodiesterase n=1 Tax=Sedimenticola thiotaurini TaxID=1543721 RepID=A0A558D495_9GAMM|nr:MAG: EAL domain-containing protein [Sedimenticola thiotaurini]